MTKNLVYSKKAPEVVAKEVSIYEKGLYIISPDVVYVSLTQPWQLQDNYFSAKKIPEIRYTKERTLSLLASYLAYNPSEIDNTFNIEVKPPYEHEVVHFAKHLIAAINNVLHINGDTSQEEIAKIENEVYKSWTYTIPLNIMLGELAQNQPYVDYLMNYHDKINITQEDIDLLSVGVKRMREPRKLKEYSESKVLRNHVVHGKFPSKSGTVFEACATVPVLHMGGMDSMKFVVYTDKLYGGKKLSMEDLKKSFINLDICIALYIANVLSENARKTSFSVDFIDPMGNVQTCIPEDYEKYVKEGQRLLESCANDLINNLQEYGDRYVLDNRSTLGVLKI